jgi:hypothetical protein
MRIVILKGVRHDGSPAMAYRRLLRSDLQIKTVKRIWLRCAIAFALKLPRHRKSEAFYQETFLLLSGSLGFLYDQPARDARRALNVHGASRG